MRKPSLIITATLIVLVFAGAYKSYGDESAWRVVEESLIRVRSGVKFETVIMLQTKLADADASIHLYQSQSRILPFDHAKRISEATTALDYLDRAMQRDKDDTANGQDLQLMAQQDEILLTYISRECSSRRWPVRFPGGLSIPLRQ